MAEQDATPQEVRITVSIGPEGNIWAHDEVLILSHAEDREAEYIHGWVLAAVEKAIVRLGEAR